MRSPYNSSSRRLAAFTLIELLTVIAVIGILSAILIPTVAGVRNSAKKTKTRVQFSQWAAAIRLFKQNYGYFPRFEYSTASSNHKVNGGLSHNSVSIDDKDYLFRELLTGKGAKPKTGGGFDFGSSEDSAPQNKKRTSFVSFDVAEITSTTGVNAGDDEIKMDGAIQDAFGNVELAVIVDRNNDGFINTNDLTGVSAYPEVTAKGGRGTLQSAAIAAKITSSDPSGNGVRADVIFYSPGAGNSSKNDIGEGDAVWSW
jgi:prepilin-type N-terminal cleavage/methylation domain-containing protein